MQSTQARLCTIDGCGGKHKARGLCLRHYQLQWASENRDKTRAATKASKAKRPEHYRQYNAEWWARNPGYGKVLYARHRESILEKQARYRRENPEQRRAVVQRSAERRRAEARRRDRQYALANPEKMRQKEARRRARKRAAGVHEVTGRDIARLILRQHGLCAYCPTPLDAKYHLDHIVPLARGGHHAIGNLAAACPPCNTSKNRSTLTEWRLRRSKAA